MNQQYYYNPNQPYYPPQIDPVLAEKNRIKMAKKKEKGEIITAGLLLGAAIIWYLAAQFIGIHILDTTGLRAQYDASCAFQYLANIIIVHICGMIVPFGLVAIILRKRFVTPAVPTNKLKPIILWSWVTAGMAICYFANVLTALVMKLFEAFGHTLTKNEYIEPSGIFDCVAMVVATAIVPAIFEELAMRCFGMGVLQKHGKGFAVFGISVVFGLLHGNVIQFIFAFSIGLILGYITIKTESVVPAMLIHGFNNLISAIQQILRAFSTEKISNIVIEVIFITFVILGIAGIVYLIRKKEFFLKREKKQKSPYKVNAFTKFLCLLPGMAIPIIILIEITKQTIL